MTEQQRKAMEMALKFIVVSSAKDKAWYTTEEFELVSALRQALAQPEQKIMDCVYPKCETAGGCNGPCSKPLYTAPLKREWVGLTDDEMEDLWNRYAHMEMMRAIEAKLKEKNT